MRLIGYLASTIATVIVHPAMAKTLDHVALATQQAGTHQVRIDNGSIAPGGLGQPALRIAPAADGSWRGGGVDFRVAVDPVKPTFFSTRLWGGDKTEGNLTLICGGKQVGDRLLSDYDQLDYGAKHPQFPGAFFYRTYRLPDAVTRGKQFIDCRIEASGPIFSYGDTFDKFQKPMAEPSRGLYDIFTHDQPWLDTAAFVDGAVTVAGVRPGDGKLGPKVAGSEVLGKIRSRIESSATGLVGASRPLSQHEIAFLAMLRHKTWTPMARDKRVLDAVVKGFDDYIAAYAADPNLVKWDKSTWNPDWFGFGPLAQAFMADPEALRPLLDKQVAWKNGTRITRRAALTEMFQASRDWLRTHRRFYTNQSMIVDLWGIYYPNRALQIIAPERAMTEQQARRYLYESTGIEEWRGDDLPDGAHTFDAGGPDGTKASPYKVVPGYHLVTRKGLTRELGYVGNYGEVGDWVGAIYEATRPAPGKPGDEKIRAQLARILNARSYFRYPTADDDGYAAMRYMADIGWRDLKAPGDVTYVEVSRDGASSPIHGAVITADPRVVGFAQQMVEDNQLWPVLASAADGGGFRRVYGLLDVIDDVQALNRMPRQAARLPMSHGQPDFVFADPQDGVVAIKRGEERFYASLWWRSNRGVSNLGKVWLSGPRGNRIATVPVKTGFDASGNFWTRPDKVVLLKSDSFNKDYGLSLAEAGERVPLAKAPAGITIKPGEDSIYAGRAENIVLSYGGYTIAMNMSDSKPFTFEVPAHQGKELLTGRDLAAGTVIDMAPQTTAIFLDNSAASASK